jgi:hypothetical protein
MKNKTNEAQLPMNGPMLHKASLIPSPEGPKAEATKEMAKELYMPKVAPFLKSLTSTVRTYKTKAEAIEAVGTLTEQEAKTLSEGFLMTAKFFETQSTAVLGKVKK